MFKRFQSHFGLILSLMMQFWILLPPMPFNPILVWFYRKAQALCATSVENFQSHFGLILSLLYISVSDSKCTFNPILVWFYQVIRTNTYKTILRLSIPFWSDFIRAVVYTKTKPFSISFNPILVWFYHNISFYHNWTNPFLSIPFWSDFIKKREKN